MKSVAIMTIFIGAFICGSSIIADERRIEITSEPLFESVGVYINYGALTPTRCEMRFRKQGALKWSEAYSPVDAKVDRQFRGSIVNLQEDCAYEIDAELFDSDGCSLGKGSCGFKTWSSTPLIAKTIELKSQGPLSISSVTGSPDAWIKYIAAPNAVIDGGNEKNAAVTVKNCAFLIFEGLSVKGGRGHGFDVTDSKNIRIVNCEVSGWGRIGTEIFSKDVIYYGAFYDERKKLINNDAGIYINGSEGVVIERCYAHDPRGRANSWSFAHPAGPNAVFARAVGSTVIRYNDFIGSDIHRWNDVIEGWGNDALNGGFNRDADIYGNMLCFGNDDGIELDGGQMNVRFFRNKVEGCLCGVSTAPNLRGPSYIFENLIVNLSDEDGNFGSVIKNGGGSTFSKGKTFFFNNTFHSDGNGISGVGFGNDKNRALFFGFSRNNILDCSNIPVNDSAMASDNSFDYDLLCNKGQLEGAYVISNEGKESHGIAAIPAYRNASCADFRLAKGSRGINEGCEIPNFSRPNINGKVDIGAYGFPENMWIPSRPIPFRCEKFQVMLKADMKSGKSNSDSVEVSLSPEAKTSIDFKTLKPDACDWLDVQPSQGRIAPGDTCLFKVSVSIDRILKPGLLKGVFLIRTSQGISLPVTVYCKARRNSFSVTIKASDFQNIGAFPLQDDKGTISGKVFALPGGSNAVPGEKFIAGEFNIPADGNYFLLVRQRAPKLPLCEHDSIFLSLDGLPPQRIDFNGEFTWKWTALNCTKIDGISRNGIPLKAGLHVVKVFPREGLLFDAFMVSLDPFKDEE